ncbi:MAG: hypothetical protein AAF492_24900, partial [Verrucomicrobiota bacterium]
MESPVPLWLEGVRALGEFGGKQNRNYLLRLTDRKKMTDEQVLGLIGLAAIDPDRAAKAAVHTLSLEPVQVQPRLVIDAFAGRKGGIDALVKAFEGKVPHPEVAKRVSLHLLRTGQSHEGLVEIFRPKPEVALIDRLLSEEVKTLTADVLAEGDPARGERVFRRKELACMSCHGIGDAGPTLGPDLAALGSAAQIDYIIEALLEPNKTIAEGYEAVAVRMKDQRMFTGNLGFQNNEELTLYDVARQGRKITLKKEEVEEIRSMPSIMPPGLGNQLKNRGEFLDLVRFLSELGKPGPYAASVKPILRDWKIQPFSLKAKDRGLWIPGYSMVDGTFPYAELSPDESSWFKTRVEVLQAGRMKLRIHQNSGVFLTGNDTEDGTIDLRKGIRTLDFVVHPANTNATGFKAELVEIPGSPARVRLLRNQPGADFFQ